MDEKEQEKEAYLNGIQSLLENIDEDTSKKIFLQLCEIVYANSDRTIDEVMDDCNRKDWTFEQRKIAKKAFVEYKSRVMMAMYYVQTFQVRKWKKEDYRYSGLACNDNFKTNWWPYLGEVSEKLQLSEDEILCIACLFLYYFIPKAEYDTGLSSEELLKRKYPSRDNYEAERAEVCYKLFKLKDLAKLYMTQRFQIRMSQARVFRDDEENIKKQVWRNILATEEMSDLKVDRMKNCPRENFAGSDIEVRFSLHFGDYVEMPEKKDINILKAYELLNQGKSYEYVMDNIGLSFKEVRVIDCFTIVRAKEEGND